MSGLWRPGCDLPRPDAVGILALEVYFPKQKVTMADMEAADGCPGKYTVGLGQEAMAFSSDREDAVAMALTVTHSLLEKYGVRPGEVGHLQVATESGVDRSKSIKSHLVRFFAEWGEQDQQQQQQQQQQHVLQHSGQGRKPQEPQVLRGRFCVAGPPSEGADVVHACYGGTAALLAAAAWVESRRWDGRLALVVAADVALYAPGTAARATGGCGAAAFLVGPDAPLVLEPQWHGGHCDHAWDFYKPLGALPYPCVDGPLTLEQYLAAAGHCAVRLAARLEAEGQLAPGEALLPHVSYYVGHAPFAKLARKGLVRVALMDKLRRRAAAAVADATTAAELAPWGATDQWPVVAETAAGAEQAAPARIEAASGQAAVASEVAAAAASEAAATASGQAEATVREVEQRRGCPLLLASQRQPASRAGGGCDWTEATEYSGVKPEGEGGCPPAGHVGAGLVAAEDEVAEDCSPSKAWVDEWVQQQQQEQQQEQQQQQQQQQHHHHHNHQRLKAGSEEAPAGPSPCTDSTATAGVRRSSISTNSTTAATAMALVAVTLVAATGCPRPCSAVDAATANSAHEATTAAATSVSGGSSLVPRSTPGPGAGFDLGPDIRLPESYESYATWGINDKALEARLLSCLAVECGEKGDDAAWLQKQLGNSYTACVWQGLAGLVWRKGYDLAGRRVLLFSFGSGTIASLFSLLPRAAKSARAQGRGERGRDEGNAGGGGGGNCRAAGEASPLLGRRGGAATHAVGRGTDGTAALAGAGLGAEAGEEEAGGGPADPRFTLESIQRALDLDSRLQARVSRSVSYFNDAAAHAAAAYACQVPYTPGGDLTDVADGSYFLEKVDERSRRWYARKVAGG